MTERLWQMTRIGSGDYTLLSNDQTVLWRFYNYPETGDLGVVQTDGTTRPVIGTFWRVLRYRHHPDTITREDVEYRDDEDTWEPVASLLPTRKACIVEAMDREPVPS